MTRFQRLTVVIFLVGLNGALACYVTFAQNAAAPARYRTIHLTSQKIDLPFGNQVFTSGDLAKLANSRCLLCHSKDMIDAQPPLTLETWKKEVGKMRTAYGCPLRADQTADLAEFISQATSASAPAAISTVRPLAAGRVSMANGKTTRKRAGKAALPSRLTIGGARSTAG